MTRIGCKMDVHESQSLRILLFVFWSIFEQKLHIYIFVKLSLVDLIFHFTADDEKSSKEDPDLDVPTLPRIEVVRRLRERYLDKLFSNLMLYQVF